MTMNGQTYESLWKQVRKASEDDLPKTERQVLSKIIAKARKEKAYGHLLKAELADASAAAMISPDSLAPAVERLKAREQKAASLPLRAVYQAVLGKIYADNPSLDDDAYALAKAYKLQAMQHPAELAAVKAADYEPLVTDGKDSRYYGDDLLSVIGYETRQFETLHRYYMTTGNREAQLLSALAWYKDDRLWESGDGETSPNLQRIDSLIERYADLQECGEAAIARYECMADRRNVTVGQKVAYIDTVLQRWGQWKRMNVLRNYRNELTNPMFNARMEWKVNIPGRGQKVKVDRLRAATAVTLKVFKAHVDGTTRLSPNAPEDYKKLKPLLTPMPELTKTLNFTGKAEHETFDAELTLDGLPVGVYMLEIEMKSAATTLVSRALHFVSDVRVLVEPLPGRKTRYVVVSATTGQPIAGATVRLAESYREKAKTVTLTADDKGECFYEKKERNELSLVYASTKDDNACPTTNIYGSFSYYENERELQRTVVYTDRSIYRPGQKVQAAAIVYSVRHGFEHEAVKGKALNVRLRDANYKTVDEKTVVTDEYGTAAAEFILPSTGLTGYFTVDFGSQSRSFRVEEYKRPTFHVDFPEVKQEYKAGDTLTVKATAKSYAGVPVQGAHVKYKVERRIAFWWRAYYRYWQTAYWGDGSYGTEVYDGETTTDADGTFEVSMPLTIAAADDNPFYNFVAVAEVTDAAGETHSGELSVPVSKRKTVLVIDAKEKMLLDRDEQPKVRLLNAAGNNVEATVEYSIDGGKWKKTATNSPIALPKLQSGSHTIAARYGDETTERSFVLFSLDDKRPATQTDDWFYVSEEQFPNSGEPVTVQVGSSCRNVHVVYSLVAGNSIIEMGAADISDELINRKFTYKDEYGDGLTLSFAWMREGKAYRHETTIRRPLPDKKLSLRWETFRDRLTPGQEEEWTLSISGPDGKPVAAQLMATLYDKSLDQFVQNRWALDPIVWLSTPSAPWAFAEWGGISWSGVKPLKNLGYTNLDFRAFDSDCFPDMYSYRRAMPMMVGSARVRGRALAKLESAGVEEELRYEARVQDDSSASNDAIGAFDVAANMKAKETNEGDAADERAGGEEMQVRENLQETAFFYPQLQADSTGRVALRFTLPESLTTWRFLGVAHTKDLMHGMLEGETVAQKDVMILPNIPRFVRSGDEASITARIFNITDRALGGTVRMQLIDAETQQVVCERQQEVSLGSNATEKIAFTLQPNTLGQYSLLICKMMVAGDSFSDGEQHYLPVLPDMERVTVTVPFTQTAPGTKVIDLENLFPKSGDTSSSVPGRSGDTSMLHPQLTVEYTNNPAWLMVQALPTVGHANDNCAVCQATSLYANSLGRYILKQNPNAKNVFESWQREAGSETSLMSELEKNEELKDLVLNETPWVMDANRESEQKKRLADFFDKSLMDHRISTAVENLKKLQNSDGSWSWWPGMDGSFYMTVEVSEMMVRLNRMTGNSGLSALDSQLDKAFKFMDREIVKMVDEMKKDEKKGYKQHFPTYKALQYLYISTLDDRTPSAKVREAQNYLKNLLRKETKHQSLYEKAMSAIVLNSKLYIKSLKEYSVYKEDMGRYYDTPRAGYSWRDYRIPTQVAAIEALQRLTPEDTKTVDEMLRWLLQEKRTQAWDTPINSVDAIYAFLNGRSSTLAPQPQTVLKVDNEELETSKATAGIGYVKATKQVAASGKTEGTPKTFTAEKTSTGTSWGAVYAQFMQKTTEVADHSSEITVKREIIRSPNATLKVGDRIKLRITIVAERDLDFVEVVDKRAACMEPVNQLSGYRQGAYCTPKDFATCYYFDMMRKGKHVIETEYYVDRAGSYETGTCTVGCAYAPEFRATTHALKLNVEE
jgi:hypothetical protein